MKFSEEDLEVYLKPHGDKFEHLRFGEKENKSLYGQRKRRCDVSATNERFDVVVGFGKNFPLFDANVVEVTIRFGAGQKNHRVSGGYLDSEALD